MKLYDSYRFLDKDPVIDEVRTIIQDEGVSLKYVELRSGVTTNTLRNWLSGPTLRPQYATVAAVARALDYDITFTKGKHK